MISLNIVAHPDDDLLFMNPDILLDQEIWNIYLTAGDDGYDYDYIQRRQEAIKHAYQGYPATFYFLHLKSNSHRKGDDEGDLGRILHDHQYIANGLGFDYTYDKLVQVLRTVAVHSTPDVIRIQSDADDHPDHVHGSLLATAALKHLGIPIHAYYGYRVRNMENNVTLDLAALKLQMWRRYQEIDTTVAGEIWDDVMLKCHGYEIK